MPPVAIAAGIGAAGAIGGAAISSNAASNAANTAAQTAASDNALQKQIYDENSANAQPYIARGNAAGDELSGFLGLGGNPTATNAAFQTFLNSTGYQFDKTQGIDAIDNNQAAKGLLSSGSTLKALDAFGTGLADQYGQQYVGNLSGVANTGENAVNALTGAGQAYANASNSNSNSAASTAATAGLTSAGQINGLIENAFNAYAGIKGGTSFLNPTYPSSYSAASLAPNAFAPASWMDN